MNASLRRLVLAFLCALVLTACADKQERLNLYIWNDYLARDTIANFEQETGIEVSVSNYGSNEELEAKLAPGNSGYDIVVPSASSYERQIKSGYYRKLDKSQLPNLKNMDPQLQQQLAAHDPGNEHAVLHMWGTTGIGYNVQKVKAAMPDAPIDSWRLVFDPEVVKSFESCGVAVLDSATEMFSMVLAYLGKNPNSQEAVDIEAAAAAMTMFRPFVRYIDTQRMISDLANGEICLAVGYNGDVLQARDRAQESHTGQEIAYSIPKEGTLVWFDSYLIPKDAPHANNAHLFINYMLRPEVIAAVSNTVNYANGNVAAAQYVDLKILHDPAIYPSAEVRARLFPDLADTEQTTRLMTRLWTRFTTGQ